MADGQALMGVATTFPAPTWQPGWRWVRQPAKGKGKARWIGKIVYLLSSPTLEELPAAGLLRRKRGSWVIESRLHHCLAVTMREDLSRVRTPNSALALGMTRSLAKKFLAPQSRFPTVRPAQTGPASGG